MVLTVSLHDELHFQVLASVVVDHEVDTQLHKVEEDDQVSSLDRLVNTLVEEVDVPVVPNTLIPLAAVDMEHIVLLVVLHNTILVVVEVLPSAHGLLSLVLMLDLLVLPT